MTYHPLVIVQRSSDNYWSAVQRAVDPADDPVIQWGPLSAPLSQLLNCGWELRAAGSVWSDKHGAKAKVGLSRKGEWWGLGAIRHSELYEGFALSDAIKACHLKRPTVQTFEVARNTTEEAFQTLLETYPRRKRTPMMGNMTLKEWVKKELL